MISSVSLVLFSVLSMAAMPVVETEHVSILSPQAPWVAAVSRDRALLEDRALVIGVPGTTVHVVDGALRLTSGAAVVIAGSAGVKLETPEGVRELRDQSVFVSQESMTAQDEARLRSVLQAPGRRPSALLPKEVEAPLPLGRRGTGSAPEFEGLDIEAMELEADCVEICLE